MCAYAVTKKDQEKPRNQRSQIVFCFDVWGIKGDISGFRCTVEYVPFAVWQCGTSLVSSDVWWKGLARERYCSVHCRRRSAGRVTGAAYDGLL